MRKGSKHSDETRVKMVIAALTRRRRPPHFLEWASIGHSYSQDRDGWLRLCKKCHARADREYRSSPDLLGPVSAGPLPPAELPSSGPGEPDPSTDA